MGSGRNILGGLAIFSVILFGSALWYSSIESLDYFDSLYSVFLTITTVGAAFPPSTDDGKVLLMFTIFFGMGAAIYIATLIASTVVEGHVRRVLTGIKGGIIRMRTEKNHIIVCGYGNLGKSVCDVLKQNKKKYLIIEKDSSLVSQLLHRGESIVQGNALDPTILEKAGIRKAKAIIGTLKSDADNIYLMMSASDINPNLLLAAEAHEEEAVKRLHKIGAQIVVLPQVVGGKQLANAVIEVEKTEEMSAISKKKV